MRFGARFKRGMSCEEVFEVLQAYLDGEVEADVARKVAVHLDKCVHCERESHVYQQIRVSLHRRTMVVDPQVMAALADFGRNLVDDER